MGRWHLSNGKVGLSVLIRIWVRAYFPETWAVSTVRRNTGSEFTRRSLKAQGFPRALIEAQGYFVEFGLRVLRQVGFLRKVLSQEPVRVFIGAALPRALWIAEVDVHLRGDGEALVTGQL